MNITLDDLMRQRKEAPNVLNGAFSYGDNVNQWDDTIAEAVAMYPNVPKDVVKSVMYQESRGNAKAESPWNPGHGTAKGLMQIIDSTADELGIMDVWDPRQNIFGGTKYLSQLIERHGSVEKAVGRYFGVGSDVTGQTSNNYAKEVMQRVGAVPSEPGGEITLEMLAAQRKLQIPEENTAYAEAEPIEIEPQDRGFFASVAEAWKRGEETGVLDALSYEVMTGKRSWDEVEPLIREFEAKQKQDPVEAKNWLSKGVMALSGMLPQVIRGIAEGQKTGLAAAGAGAAAAAIGGQMGPQVALPEEVVTVPGAAALGLTVGSAFGAAEFWRRGGAGAMFREMKMAGIKDKTAATAAQIASVPFALIEQAQILRVIPGADKALRGIVAKTLVKRLGQLALHRGVDVAQESFGEGVQGAIQQTAKEISQYVDGQLRGDDLDDTAKRVLIAFKTDFIESIVPMSLMILPKTARGGVDIAMQDRNQAGQNQAQSVNTEGAPDSEARIENMVNAWMKPVREGYTPLDVSEGGDFVTRTESGSKIEKPVILEGEGKLEGGIEVGGVSSNQGLTNLKPDDTLPTEVPNARSSEDTGLGSPIDPTRSEPGRTDSETGGAETGRFAQDEGRYYEDLIRTEDDAESLIRESTPSDEDIAWWNRDPDEIDRELTELSDAEEEAGSDYQADIDLINKDKAEYEKAKTLTDLMSGFTEALNPEDVARVVGENRLPNYQRWLAKPGKGTGVDRFRMDFVAEYRDQLKEAGIPESDLADPDGFINNVLDEIPSPQYLFKLRGRANRKPKYHSGRAVMKRREAGIGGVSADASADRFASRREDLNLDGDRQTPPPGKGGEPEGVARPHLVELPELVEFSKDLLKGKYPRVKRALRAARGRALGVAYGNERIDLRADIFEDLEQTAKTLSHEIFHVVDHLPENVKRGNILGRIASLKKHLATTIDELPRDPSQALTPKDRRRLRRLSERAIGPRPAKDEEADLAAWREEVSEEYQRRLRDELDSRGLITRDEVMEELKALSQEWKPFDEGADPKYTKYRHKSSELYADAGSVLLNEPVLLDRRAPRFYKSLLAYMERKPEVKAIYDSIQSRIGSGRENVLEDRSRRVREGFAKGEEIGRRRAEEAGKTRVGILEGIKKTLVERNARLANRAKKARGNNKLLDPDKNPLYWVEELPYMQSEVFSYFRDIDNDVRPIFEDAGMSREDFGEYLLHRRSATERAGIAGPEGIGGKFAQDQLGHMRRKLGNEKYAKLEGAADRFWKLRQEVIIPRLEQSGMYSEDLMNKIRDNENYATFDVVKHMKEHYGPGAISSSIKKQIGTLEAVGNVFEATIMKDAVLLRAAHRTETAKALADFLQQHDPDAIRTSETRFDSNYKTRMPVESGDPAFKTVKFLDNGKMVGYDIDREMADAFEMAPHDINAFTKAMMGLSYPFKMIFTQKNPFWVFRNVLRDFGSFYKNIPDLSLKKALQYMKAAVPHAKADVYEGVSTDVVREMYRNKELVVGRIWAAKELTDADTEYDRMMLNYGQTTRKHKNKVLKPFLWLNEQLENAAQFSERLTKIAGHMYLTNEEAGRGAKEIAHVVRTRAGSPDFLRGGAARLLYNNIWMFSNANIQGWRAAKESFNENPGRFAFKTTVNDVLPKMVQYAAEAGAIAFLAPKLGEKLKEWYEKIPEHDKTRYHCIPFTETKNGRAVYFVLPHDHVGQAVGGLTRKLVQVAGKRREDEVRDLVRFGTSEVPFSGLNPVLSIGSKWAQYLAGTNPIDSYHGKRIVNEKKFEGGAKLATPDMLRWSAAEAGGSIYLKLDGDNIDDVANSFEKLYGIPIIGRGLHTFLRVSDSGAGADLSRVGRQARRKEIQAEYKFEGQIVDHFNKQEGAPKKSDARSLHRDLKKKGYAKDFGQFWSRYQNLAISKYADSEIRALSHAPSKAAREAMIDELLKKRKDLTAAQKKSEKRKMMRKARLFKELVE
jgi:hypothetical protein